MDSSRATLTEQLQAAVVALRHGGIVAFPTETYYGLAVDALDVAALGRLQALKGRAADKAVACIAANLDQVAQLTQPLSDHAAQLAARFWPGPLTLVLPARGQLPRAIAPEGYVGVRISSHPVARALAQGLGRPITATSANLAGEPPVRTAAALDPILVAATLVLDIGETEGGAPSTVLRVDGGGLTLIRVGAIPLESLATDA